MKARGGVVRWARLVVLVGIAFFGQLLTAQLHGNNAGGGGGAGHHAPMGNHLAASHALPIFNTTLAGVTRGCRHRTPYYLTQTAR